MKPVIGAYVYWEDGRLIGRHRISLRTKDEGVIVNDGRVVKRDGDRWIYYG